MLSLVERFLELKYVHDVATPALLYAIKNQLVASKAPYYSTLFCLLLAGSLWHKGWVASMQSWHT